MISAHGRARGYPAINSMKAFGYIWTILQNLFTLFIAFAVFSTAEGKFAKIVMALLILIYLQVITFFTTWARTTLTMAMAMDVSNNRIRVLLHEDEDDLADVETLQQKINDSNVTYWINSVFTFVLYIVAIFNIVTNL